MEREPNENSNERMADRPQRDDVSPMAWPTEDDDGAPVAGTYDVDGTPLAVDDTVLQSAEAAAIDDV